MVLHIESCPGLRNVQAAVDVSTKCAITVIGEGGDHLSLQYHSDVKSNPLLFSQNENRQLKRIIENDVSIGKRVQWVLSCAS